MEENLAANTDAAIDTAPEGIATPELTETAEPAPDPQEQKITKIVSERIKKEQERIAGEAATKASQAEQARVNAFIAKLYGENGITTIEQAEEALRQRELEAEAARQQIPLEILTELHSTKETANQALSKLSQYERREALAKEAEALSKDPKWGSFYKANEGEIRRIAEQFKNCDLNTAKLIVYDNLGPEDRETIANKAIQDFIDKKKTLKPTEGSGPAPVVVPSQPKTWDEAREGAKAYLKSLRE